MEKQTSDRFHGAGGKLEIENRGTFTELDGQESAHGLRLHFNISSCHRRFLPSDDVYHARGQ